MATLGLAFLAGILSVLSPCVVPLLPLVLGAAASEHKYGPAALAVGLAISFVAIGLFVATIGFAIGLDGDVFRRVAAVLLVLVGVVLMVSVAQTARRARSSRDGARYLIAIPRRAAARALHGRPQGTTKS